MSQVKIGQFKFGQDAFTLRYVLGGEQPVKFVAKDIASSLKYGNCKDAVSKHVDKKYKYTYSEPGARIAPPGSNSVARQGDPLYLQPHTVLITKEGVIQLIMKSKLPYAVELQAWLLEEVIPQVLCTGKYAPAVEMDTNHGVIEELNKKLTFASESLAEANEKIIHFANALVTANTGLVQANAMLNEARKDCENARRETAQLANRMADIAQDVIAKPSNPQLCHSLAVCDIGNNEFAFLRPQKRSLSRSLKRLGFNNVIFSSDYVPNSMNVLNKVKEAIPRNKFKAKHNRITLLEDYTREELMNLIGSTMTDRQIARMNSLRNAQ
ncbi:bro-b protein [Thysanoplusia orichalcea nucleopolyhedrovirus]|uniref:Bro-b protein n=1 Tax=Thysanoplusia orichalcea nucleopolyhedrovirus TaxID=101850 RepID=L0CLQ2_9ABAC|nr:bro-b protein [Thysanoplusia orichalcea nucleopolyhedrovirus]AGA16248.1 bro-b protein [Thysanoplusia orichalcea nucleopolyhedrovirus]